MCGIAGVLAAERAPVAAHDIASMNALQAHRGPDSSGVHVDGHLGLGHTRLAVMDPTLGGHQPMSYADGGYWITYNGEVYNFLEIREELEGHGHRFRGESDTEVIVAAYAQWGEECQHRLNGEWAFAIWDERQNRLFLSRDRFGVKPLYYYFDGKHFAFASEMKAFVGLSWFAAAFDDRAVAAAILNFQAFEGTEYALFTGVRRLPAGHSMVVEASKEPHIRRWWRTLDHLVPTHRETGKQAERLRELLFDACAIRMRSDIPLGTALSGGLDSSVVHCAMAHINAQGARLERQAESWDKAIVGLLAGWGEGEKDLARDVIRHAGTEGVFKELRPEDALDRLGDLIVQFEQVAPIPVGQWILYRELRRIGIQVSMEGHGADEAFAGFREGPKIAFIDTVRKLHDYVDAMTSIGIVDASELPDLKWISAINSIPRFNLETKVGVFPVVELVRVQPYAFTYPIWENDIGDLAEFDALTRTLYLEFHCDKTPWILHDFEMASMAHGVEIRAPFLDWRIVCYGFSLPVESKIKNGYSKYLVREAMRGLMPEVVRTRTRKVGFPLPLYSWFQGPLHGFILDCVGSRRFLDSAIWDGPAVKDRVEKAIANRDLGRLRHLWSFVQADRLIEGLAAKAALFQQTNVPGAQPAKAG